MMWLDYFINHEIPCEVCHVTAISSKKLTKPNKSRSKAGTPKKASPKKATPKKATPGKKSKNTPSKSTKNSSDSK